VDPPVPLRGLSFEMQRFSDGMRIVIAMLCSVLLVGGPVTPEPAALLLLIAYDLWAGALLWARSRSLSLGSPLVHFWLDAAWSCALLLASADAANMLVLTLVHPTVLVSVGYGTRQGVLLAVSAASAVAWASTQGDVASLTHRVSGHVVPALAVLALVPAAALLTRSMGVLHQRRQLMARIEAGFDARRGLAATAALLAQTVQRETGASLAALVLHDADGRPVWLAAADRPAARRVAPQRATLIADLCGRLSAATTLRRPKPARPAPGLDELAALADLFGCAAVVAVPMQRDGQLRAHLLLGAPAGALRDEDLEALDHAAPELLRLLDTATLVDRLQDESAAHERARIGRDLHDSAIQPYLGIKYAIESVALRAPADHPLGAELRALSALVNDEVEGLRELIVGMRSGDGHGDSALVSAVRRQAARFSQTFGVAVHVDSPAELPTSRALAGALFHMVNEALNNVRKHTPARQVHIRLQASADGLELRVRDDAGSLRGTPMPAFRPRSLSERATELGGTLVVSRPDGLDTELLVYVPLHPDAPRRASGPALPAA
jgi:signal transduction histidine kinase